MKSSDGSWRNAAFGLAPASLILISLILAGCSQRGGMPTIETAASPDQHLPFESPSEKGGISPTGELTPAAIPAGTPLTVHLRLALSSATSRSGDSFTAVLDEPLVIRGQIVAERGAILTGKVLDASASGQFENAGYLRLGLIAISINGRLVPIQTSSIFVKRGSHDKRNAAVINDVSTGGLAGNRPNTLIEASSGTANLIEHRDVGVSADHPLTFRLARPLPL